VTRDEFIREFAALLDVDPGQLQPGTDLKSIQTWDSVAYLSAMVLIDEQLGIILRPEALSKAATFQDIVQAVEPAFRN
jgi:acyl carrier protein